MNIEIVVDEEEKQLYYGKWNAKTLPRVGDSIQIDGERFRDSSTDDDAPIFFVTSVDWVLDADDPERLLDVTVRVDWWNHSGRGFQFVGEED